MARLTPFWILLSSMLLVACGGGSGSVVPSADTDDSTGETPTDGGSNETQAGVTYFPLQFYLSGDAYVEEGDVYDGIWFSPLIHGYIIAPVDDIDLEALASPAIDDYTLTINDQPIDRVEQGLIMQKIIDLPVTLNTAIIIDTSGSTQAVDKAALIASVKDFVATAQADSDTVIAQQQFTLWAFGSSVEPLISTFTTDAAAIDSALDALVADWSGSRGNGSALYESIVYAIGSYVGNGAAELANEVNLETDGVDDLDDGYSFDVDYKRIDGVVLSNVVVFTTGQNSVNRFSVESAQEALEWQSLIAYVELAETEEATDTTDTTESTTDTTDSADIVAAETTLVGKPLIYVSLGTDGADSLLSGLSAKVIDTNSNTAFDVADELVLAQKNAITVRMRPSNQYLVRYQVLDRDGKHTHVFSSSSSRYSYALTTDLDLASTDLTALPEASAEVEITGPNNGYLAGAQVSATSVKNLYPATRWTTVSYSNTNYSWTVGGINRSANADGSISITAADAGQTVELTNTSLSISSTVTVRN